MRKPNSYPTHGTSANSTASFSTDQNRTQTVTQQNPQVVAERLRAAARAIFSR